MRVCVCVVCVCLLRIHCDRIFLFLYRFGYKTCVYFLDVDECAVIPVSVCVCARALVGLYGTKVNVHRPVFHALRPLSPSPLPRSQRACISSQQLYCFFFLCSPPLITFPSLSSTLTRAALLCLASTIPPLLFS